MSTEFGFKELYDVVLKSSNSISIGDRTIDPNEIIAQFDKIQIANLNELQSHVTARGGYGNQAWVYWNSTREVQMRFEQGIFSKEQFALLTNAKLITKANDSVNIQRRESLESDEDGVITTKYNLTTPIFVYDAATGSKLSYTKTGDKTLTIATAYKDVIVDYIYNYSNTYDLFTVGEQLITGFLSLEGKTRVKDDITGQTHTGIIRIPKLRLMSNLSMSLGRNAIPVVGSFDAVAYPTGGRNENQTMSLILLGDDIDSDI